jgi:maltose-binding protein MalE
MTTNKKNILLAIAGWSVALIILTLQLLGCGSNDPEPAQPEPTQAEKITTLLTAAAWPLQSVSVEGEDADALFKDFSITFTSAGYTTTGTTPVWKRTGTWVFTDETATKFNRDDNIEVTIVSVDDKTLKLALQWTETLYGGRSGALRGRHEFTLTR